MMLLDRTIQPKVRDIEHLAVQMPQRFIMPNGVPLNILNSGDNEVVRIDLLIEGGRWHQSQPLQALFTNRMLREERFDTARWRLQRNWIITAPGWNCQVHRNMHTSLFTR